MCRLLGAEHVGGRGQPDCRLGAAVVEVKHHNKRVGADIIRRTMAKPWAHGLPLIVVSTSGFSDRALAFAQQHTNVFLYVADLAMREVRQIWPEVEALPTDNTSSWWPVAAVGGLAALVGGVVLAARFLTPRPNH